MNTIAARTMKTSLGFGLLAVLAGCTAMTGDGAESSSDALNLGSIAGGGAVALDPITVDASFTVTGLANKCVDFGGEAYQAIGSPVMLYACNGTVAQKVHVVEIADGSHDVSLRASKGLCFGVRGAVAVGNAIELEACDPTNVAQRFALDGDTIFVGSMDGGHLARSLVVEVQGGKAANRTPLVVGARDVDDAEYFAFDPTSFAALFPTMGFTMAMSVGDLDRALASATWGTVIEIAPDTDLTIDDTNERHLSAGVTLRGNRRFMADGQQINRHAAAAGTFLQITGNDARITGLRLRGPDTTMDDDAPLVTGVLAPQAFRATIDHNEMSAWTSSAVGAAGDFEDDGVCPSFPSTPVENVHVLKNYMHENQREGEGYGVVSGDGANPLIFGNTFDHNRHAIAADANAETHYDAVGNLVTAGNEYCSVWPICWKEQDIDVHGSDPSSHHQGGIAGGGFTIASNTLYSTGKNVDIRGTPCGLITIEDNVFVEDQDTAIKNATTIPQTVQITSNTFSAARGATFEADFDGDGTQDTFIATGAAWYYMPGGTKEARFLRLATQQVGDLTFKDVDADGRMDVQWVNPRLHLTQTSYGGSSPWEVPIPVVVGRGGVGSVGSLF